MLRRLNALAVLAQEDLARLVQAAGYLRDQAAAYPLVLVAGYLLAQAAADRPVQGAGYPLVPVVASLLVLVAGYPLVRAVDAQQGQEVDAHQTQPPEYGCRVTANRRRHWAGANTSYPYPFPIDL